MYLLHGQDVECTEIALSQGIICSHPAGLDQQANCVLFVASDNASWYNHLVSETLV